MKSKNKLVGKTTGKKKAAVITASNVGGPIAPLVAEPEVAAAASESPSQIANPIYTSAGRLLIVVLILGWGLDYLFWKQGVGINFAIFAVLCLMGGGYWLLSTGIRPAKKALWLLIPFFFFGSFTFIRQEPLTVFLVFAYTLISLGLFASVYQGADWMGFSPINYLYKAMQLVGDALTAFPFYIARTNRVQAASGTGKSGSPIWSLLRGALIALPIVLCFGSLLAAGDLVFKEKLDQFLDLDDLSENIFRSILILLYAYLLAGVFIHSALRSHDERTATENQRAIKPILGFSESAVILGSVLLLFLAFVIVQFQYFFGGETNIGVEGYTYSQYARRGFNELVTVSFFSMILLILLSTLTKRDSERQRRIFSMLNVSVVALVMVILVSAYQRISLSIGWHGYSRLRLYPRIFLIWLALLLVTVVILEIVKRQRYFTFAILLTAVGFAGSLTLFNVDAAIVTRNVFRAWHGHNLNVPHLASLSSDAIPALAHEFLLTDLPASTHEGVGAILACYKYYEESPHVSMYDWRYFNLSRWQAHEALIEVRPNLAGYVIRFNKWPVRVRTPSGVVYDCTAYDAANDNE